MPELLRMAERISCVLFGGVSLILGYRLFVLGINLPQPGEIKIDQLVTIRSKAFAPGLFFATLGSAVLVYSIGHPISTSDTVTPPTPGATNVASVHTFRGLGGSSAAPRMSPDDAKKLIKALNAFSSQHGQFAETAEGAGVLHEMDLLKQELLAVAFPSDTTAVKAF